MAFRRSGLLSFGTRRGVCSSLACRLPSRPSYHVPTNLLFTVSPSLFQSRGTHRPRRHASSSPVSSSVPSQTVESAEKSSVPLPRTGAEVEQTLFGAGGGEESFSGIPGDVDEDREVFAAADPEESALMGEDDIVPDRDGAQDDGDPFDICDPSFAGSAAPSVDADGNAQTKDSKELSLDEMFRVSPGNMLRALDPHLIQASCGAEVPSRTLIDNEIGAIAEGVTACADVAEPFDVMGCARAMFGSRWFATHVKTSAQNTRRWAVDPMHAMRFSYTDFRTAVMGLDAGRRSRLQTPAVIPIGDDSMSIPAGYETVVDAVLGTGVKLTNGWALFRNPRASVDSSANKRAAAMEDMHNAALALPGDEASDKGDEAHEKEALDAMLLGRRLGEGTGEGDAEWAERLSADFGADRGMIEAFADEVGHNPFGKSAFPFVFVRFDADGAVVETSPRVPADCEEVDIVGCYPWPPVPRCAEPGVHPAFGPSDTSAAAGLPMSGDGVVFTAAPEGPADPLEGSALTADVSPLIVTSVARPTQFAYAREDGKDMLALDGGAEFADEWSLVEDDSYDVAACSRAELVVQGEGGTEQRTEGIPVSAPRRGLSTDLSTVTTYEVHPLGVGAGLGDQCEPWLLYGTVAWRRGMERQILELCTAVVAAGYPEWKWFQVEAALDLPAHTISAGWSSLRAADDPSEGVSHPFAVPPVPLPLAVCYSASARASTWYRPGVCDPLHAAWVSVAQLASPYSRLFRLDALLRHGMERAYAQRAAVLAKAGARRLGRSNRTAVKADADRVTSLENRRRIATAARELLSEVRSGRGGHGNFAAELARIAQQMPVFAGAALRPPSDSRENSLNHKPRPRATDPACPSYEEHVASEDKGVVEDGQNYTLDAGGRPVRARFPFCDEADSADDLFMESVLSGQRYNVLPQYAVDIDDSTILTHVITPALDARCEDRDFVGAMVVQDAMWLLYGRPLMLSPSHAAVHAAWHRWHVYMTDYATTEIRAHGYDAWLGIGATDAVASHSETLAQWNDPSVTFRREQTDPFVPIDRIILCHRLLEAAGTRLPTPRILLNRLLVRPVADQRRLLASHSDSFLRELMQWLGYVDVQAMPRRQLVEACVIAVDAHARLRSKTGAIAPAYSSYRVILGDKRFRKMTMSDRGRRTVVDARGDARFAHAAHMSTTSTTPMFNPGNLLVQETIAPSATAMNAPTGRRVRSRSPNAPK
eukprot:TRINITY_DN68491_c0_g1_i1.p1 TRINITY_DN68491_c0_g1~~TRINITY_DN68491_c0_g1_i1.p1  ORF type:complete len:1219 (-),score=158.87 TRINITY_DN68491_c0_g1_i1:88-3744(-)